METVLGVVFIDSGHPYGNNIITSALHRVLLDVVPAPSDQWIAASHLIEAERDWYLRNKIMYQAKNRVASKIKTHSKRYPKEIDLSKHLPLGYYEFGARVDESNGDGVHAIFESEVAVTINGLYMVSERVQKLVKALTSFGIETFKKECDDSGTNDGLSGITSRLLGMYERSISGNSVDLESTKIILGLRGKRTHTGHLFAVYEVADDYSVVDVLFNLLSHKGDGTRDWVLRFSQLEQAQFEYRRFLKWFVESISEGAFETPVAG